MGVPAVLYSILRRLVERDLGGRVRATNGRPGPGWPSSLGFRRYWFAEHHSLPAVASSSPEVLIAHVAAHTERIRVGSGGIMLPNHTPLRVAEAFNTLAALHPDRIDLGLGRAPGSEAVASKALRAFDAPTSRAFSSLVSELLLPSPGSCSPAGHPFAPLTAMPDDAVPPPIWILGSSGASAASAGRAGLGYARSATHFTAEPPDRRSARTAPVLSSRPSSSPSTARSPLSRWSARTPPRSASSDWRRRWTWVGCGSSGVSSHRWRARRRWPTYPFNARRASCDRAAPGAGRGRRPGRGSRAVDQAHGRIRCRRVDDPHQHVGATRPGCAPTRLVAQALAWRTSAT